MGILPERFENDRSRRPHFLRGADEAERREQVPASFGKTHAQWKIENARLVAFGLWLVFLVGILASIDEMGGW